MEILDKLLSFIPTDQDIGGFVQTVKADYIIVAIVSWKLLGKPMVMLFKWIASFTPWKSDDELWDNVESKIDDAVSRRLGIPSKE